VQNRILTVFTILLNKLSILILEIFSRIVSNKVHRLGKRMLIIRKTETPFGWESEAAREHAWWS